MSYMPRLDRYDGMLYRRTGRTALLVRVISLGLWNNFGHESPFSL
jgi:L-glyceraldehyde 3-phosphate reductase